MLDSPMYISELRFQCYSSLFDFFFPVYILSQILDLCILFFLLVTGLHEFLNMAGNFIVTFWSALIAFLWSRHMFALSWS